ncbi:hypothetical protein [Sulfuritalea sp.]|uniref:hypothetical protein n=1 Tax=Sulfuritalea sp. TaxID=2480090 RepID=UPI001ACFF951|nr:hypothetical protein [Sulfuritalea sp.]MBN8475756.1 hypothetical protein [Sulfuritalea sp.]
MFKTGLIVAGAAVVAGCAPHLHQLQADSSPALVRGEFIHENPRRLTLTIGDRPYTAEGFEIHRHTNLAELQRRYKGTDPKHWDRIFAGHDRSHEVYSAEPVPRAQDGAELSCRLTWGAGKPPQGICQDQSGKEYQVRFD